MKNSRTVKLLSLSLVVFGTLIFTSCQKYRKYDNNEVMTNTYAGAVMTTSTGNDPAGDFEGDGDSGEYSFAWENSKKRAEARFDITTNTGSVQMIIYDARGNEVLNETRSSGGNDTFSGITEEGKKGMWKVTLILTDFNGDGSYSLNPID